jgi:hypothetical protein
MTVHDQSTRGSDAEPGWAPVPPGAAPAGEPADPGAQADAGAVPPTWTPPAASDVKPGNGRAKLAVAGAIVAAAVVGAGVTAGIMAGSHSGTTPAAPGAAAGRGGAGGAGGPGFGGGRSGGGPGGFGAAAAALHGTSVVPDGNGGYITELSQNGTVSAVSTSSITVKSEDGFTQTYVVGSATSVDGGADTIGNVAAGHTVRVVATGTADKATATQIQDTSIATTQQGVPGGVPGGVPQNGTPQSTGTGT